MGQSLPTTDEGSIRASERKRISRGLHDSTSQLLTALQLQIGYLRGLELQDAEPLIEEMAETIQEIRLSIKQIETQPSDFGDSGEAQRAIARRFCRLTTPPAG